MTRITVAAVGLASLLAACGGTADTTTSAAPVAITASTTSTSTTTQPTTPTVAAVTCDEYQEYFERVGTLLGGLADGSFVVRDTMAGLVEGSIGDDEGAEILSGASESFADIKEDWRNLGTAPPGFEVFQDHLLQSFAKFIEATDLMVQSLSLDGSARAAGLFRAIDLATEGMALAEEGLEEGLEAASVRSC